MLLAVLAGCGEGLFKFDWFKKEPKDKVEEGFVDASVPDLADSLALKDTVAEQGWFEGLRFMRVRGYGIVAGLGTRGSRECPRQVRERLIQEMYKRPEFGRQGLEPPPLTPEQLIDDLDTAVVRIEGEIPAAAAPATRFDVSVVALPGTQTTSLEGGSLYTTDLHVYRDVPGGGAVEGKTLASAAGSIFINPFGGDSDAATRRNPREGVVLGGGVVKVRRRVRFVLSQPSYQRVQLITSRINARFAGAHKTAEGRSWSSIDIHMPPQFENDPFRFLALVRHLYLPTAQGFADQRARDLADEIRSPNAPHPDIALAWEGIGRTALPVVQSLYDAPEPHARFYAALAGLRMGDSIAVEPLVAFVNDPDSPYRLTGIEELGRAEDSYQAGTTLRQLLNHGDPWIRIAAYEALLARSDRVISSTPVGDRSFFVDQVESTGDNLIYVRRTGEPRIALLGARIRCIPPIFYRDPNGQLTIDADDDAQELTLIRKSPFSDRTSPPLPASFDVAALISMLGDSPRQDRHGDVHGLAMDYSSIVHVLYELCRTHSINAEFLLQRATVEEMFGPVPSGARREYDPSEERSEK